MNSRYKGLIAIVLGLMVVAAAATFMFTRDGDLDERNGGETYMNSDYGFSFDYPDGYNLIEVSDLDSLRHSVVLSREESVLVPENGEGPTAITVDVFTNPSTTSTEAWVRENNVSNFNLATSDLAGTSIDGENALTYEWDGLYRGRSVVFMYDGNIILVSGAYLETSDQIYGDFDEVVSSFEFE